MHRFIYKNRLIVKISRYISIVLMLISVALLVMGYYIYSLPTMGGAFILLFKWGLPDLAGEEENEERDKMQKVKNTKHYS